MSTRLLVAVAISPAGATKTATVVVVAAAATAVELGADEIGRWVAVVESEAPQLVESTAKRPIVANRPLSVAARFTGSGPSHRTRSQRRRFDDCRDLDP